MKYWLIFLQTMDLDHKWLIYEPRFHGALSDSTALWPSPRLKTIFGLFSTSGLLDTSVGDGLRRQDCKSAIQQDMDRFRILCREEQVEAVDKEAICHKPDQKMAFDQIKNISKMFSVFYYIFIFLFVRWQLYCFQSYGGDYISGTTSDALK